MKNSNIIIWLLGVGLIVILCVLLAGYFNELRLLLLDGGVLICVYSLFIYAYGGLYYDREEFARDVPAAGVRIPALWLYSTLALTGIVAGYAYSVSFSWQTFYQMCFLFLMIVGLLLGKASTERLHQVANNSQQLQQSKEQLVSLAQHLRVAASVNTSIDAELKASISRLSERIGYISPSTSPMAKGLEDSLRGTVKQLQDMLNSGASLDTLSGELQKAETLLSQRLKTY
jgi:MFS family permease